MENESRTYYDRIVDDAVRIIKERDYITLARTLMEYDRAIRDLYSIEEHTEYPFWELGIKFICEDKE